MLVYLLTLIAFALCSVSIFIFKFYTLVNFVHVLFCRIPKFFAPFLTNTGVQSFIYFTCISFAVTSIRINVFLSGSWQDYIFLWAVCFLNSLHQFGFLFCLLSNYRLELDLLFFFFFFCFFMDCFWISCLAVLLFCKRVIKVSLVSCLHLVPLFITTSWCL